MIPLLALLAAQAIQPPAASIDGFPVGVLPEQHFPASGCAIFLWSRTPSEALVAYAMSDPAVLRVSVGGRVHDLALTSQGGAGAFAFAPSAQYKDAEVTATLDMKIDAGLLSGTRISQATLKINPKGQDDFTVPVGGYMACV